MHNLWYNFFIGSLKSLTSNKKWFHNVFTSESNHSPISQFCGVVLGLIKISKMISESPSRYVRPPAIGFLLSGHPPFNCFCEVVFGLTTISWGWLILILL